eukprot:TRINITY_DN320_c0_g5_i2.p1 TRINITY_DN320_c0_g5~~TRINITY_DN320_c0_g5_i2.p1  ORF type:complete len:486 (-),score=79.53 TRINITY_DN320_c0_g5_i2:670-2127(-)
MSGRHHCVLFFLRPIDVAVMRSRRRQAPVRYTPLESRPSKRQRAATTKIRQVVSVSASSRAEASPVSFSDAEVKQLRQSLLDWYVDNYRTLPWRASPRHRKHGLPPLPAQRVESDTCAGAPYAVWISEMMSQQTRISVVVEYYERWMKRFPSVQQLARASLKDVYELWAGLGYYRRARFVHEAAKQIVESHDGVIPQDVAQLTKLSGIGMYTAGAISSIAYGNAVPLVDGNVQRVLSRLRTGVTRNATNQNELSRVYWRLASTCVNEIENAADFNQALMELGATVCKPKGALCGQCPVRNVCEAFQEAIAAEEKASEYVMRYPIKDKKKRTKVRNESVVALVVCDVGAQDGTRRVLMRVREGNGLLSGLLETSNVVVRTGDADEVQHAVHTLLNELRASGYVQSVEAERERVVEAGRIKHVFSHIVQDIHIKLLAVNGAACTERGDAERAAAQHAMWIDATELRSRAVSTQMKKIIMAALERVGG